MPINDLQLRLREIGRLRMGDQIVTKSGKTAPNRLSKFRLTSADQRILEEAAAHYGGTPRPWQGNPGQYELYIEADEVPIYIHQSAAISQHYELWSGGGCKRRCNGSWDEASDCPCQCDPDNRECKPTTRLSVMLYELSGVGVWRLETHGYYAAVELPGAAELLRMRAEQGGFLPATLAIEHRTIKRDGKTKNFPVPVIRLREKLVNLLRPVPQQQQVTAQPQQLAIASRADEADARKEALKALRASHAWHIDRDDREGTVREIGRVLQRDITVETFALVTADDLVAVRMILEAQQVDAWDDGGEDAVNAAPSAAEVDPCPACGTHEPTCLCPPEEITAARERLASQASGTLLDVPAAATPGHAQ